MKAYHIHPGQAAGVGLDSSRSAVNFPTHRDFATRKNTGALYGSQICSCCGSRIHSRVEEFNSDTTKQDPRGPNPGISVALNLNPKEILEIKDTRIVQIKLGDDVLFVRESTYGL